jgi:hypothetical protein
MFSQGWDFAWIVPFLFLVTALCVLVFAMMNKSAVERRRRDPDQPKSTLATDGPQGGVAPINADAVRRQEDEPWRKDVPPVKD